MPKAKPPAARRPRPLSRVSRPLPPDRNNSQARNRGPVAFLHNAAPEHVELKWVPVQREKHAQNKGLDRVHASTRHEHDLRMHHGGRRFGMLAQEFVQDMKQRNGRGALTHCHRTANIVRAHCRDGVRPFFGQQKVTAKFHCGDLRDVLVLSNGQHLILRETAQCNAIIKSNQGQLTVALTTSKSGEARSAIKNKSGRRPSMPLHPPR